MKFTAACNIINNTYRAIFREEWTAARLKRERITPADFYAIYDMFKDLSRPGATAETLIKGAAEFYKRHGYNVTETAIGYKINAPVIER